MKIDIYIKKSNKTYDTAFGIPFECVELIRRFFSIFYNISFPSVVNAIDFFNRIVSLSNTKTVVQLDTFSYPYTRKYSYYLRPGTILFWKYTKSYFPHGHVALIADSNDTETTVIQQNLNPPVKIYNTKELFTKMNCVDSKFLGVKTLPDRIPRIEYNIVRL
jgi:hypothetical protein